MEEDEGLGPLELIYQEMLYGEWEYRSILLAGDPADHDRQMNALGADRWELVSIYRHPARDANVATFKRRLES